MGNKIKTFINLSEGISKLDLPALHAWEREFGWLPEVQFKDDVYPEIGKFPIGYN